MYHLYLQPINLKMLIKSLSFQQLSSLIMLLFGNCNLVHSFNKQKQSTNIFIKEA